MLQYQKLSPNAAVTGTGTVQVAVGNLCIINGCVSVCVVQSKGGCMLLAAWLVG